MFLHWSARSGRRGDGSAARSVLAHASAERRLSSTPDGGADRRGHRGSGHRFRPRAFQTSSSSPRESSVARRERGAAAVEMAIVLPLLLLVVGGLVDFGRAYYINVVITNAAREGARMVAMGYTTAQATTGPPGCGGSRQPDRSPSYTTCPSATGDATATVSHPHGAGEQPVPLAGPQRRPVLLRGQRSHSKPERDREHAMQRMNVMIRLSRRSEREPSPPSSRCCSALVWSSDSPPSRLTWAP